MRLETKPNREMISVKERIIDYSTVMFTTYGLKSVRMDDIAAQLGISKRTIYEIFGDKEALIEACVRHYSDKRAKTICERKASAGNIIDELFIIFSTKEDDIQKSFTLMDSLKRFYPKVHRRIVEENFEAGTRDMRDQIHKGISQGVVVPQLDVDMAVMLFVDLMQAVFNRMSLSTSLSAAASLKDTVRYAVIFFIRGIATQKGVRMIDKYLKERS